MASGVYEYDDKGRRHFRPHVPMLPRLDDVADLLLPAMQRLMEFDLRLKSLQTEGMIGRLFARLDAVHSSGAEGSTTTFTDLMEFDTVAAAAPDPDDAAQVMACAQAFEELTDRDVDVTMAVLLIHGRLFAHDKDRFKAEGAGKFKKNSNSTYDTDEPDGWFRYTLPRTTVKSLMEWNEFTMKRDTPVPELVRQAASHWMFEHIHPVPDGNGRIGRLLVPLVTKWKGETSTACAFLGEAVHENKDLYIEGLKGVRRSGDMMPWTRMFLSFIEQNARANLERLDRITGLQQEWSASLKGVRADSLLHRLVPWAVVHPAFTVKDVTRQFKVSFPTANDAIGRIVDLGIAQVADEARRDRMFLVPEVLDVFDRFRSDPASVSEAEVTPSGFKNG